jgi:hypothetical protein
MLTADARTPRTTHSFDSRRAGELRARHDLLPKNWTARSWKILIYPSVAEGRIFHEEVAVQRSADRVRVAAGRRRHDRRGDAGSLSVATLIQRLAAISKAHTTLRLPSPTSSDLVRMTMRGIRRTHGKPQHQVAAAIKEDVLTMVAKLGDRPKDRRDRALLLIGFAGAFWRSELAASNFTDIEHVPQGIIITVNRSKTDQDGNGRKIGIPYARGLVCPMPG